MNIIEFEQYLRFMEGFLSGEFEKPYRSLEDLRTAMHQSSNTLTRDEGEVEIAPEEYYALARYEQLDNFASILRRSFFVTLYRNNCATRAQTVQTGAKTELFQLNSFEVSSL
ncbi:MAG: hypothetical protein WBW48_04175 [Anaerolineae bacterium]